MVLRRKVNQNPRNYKNLLSSPFFYSFATEGLRHAPQPERAAPSSPYPPLCTMMKRNIFWAFLTIALTAAAVSPLQDSMLRTFLRYASVDSQSSNDSTCTAGQREMARVIKADVDSAISAAGTSGATSILSDDAYLYVIIPANTATPCPTLGISCHLDVTPEAPGGTIRPIVDTRDGRTIVHTDGTTLLGADDKCGCTIAVELIRTLLADSTIRHGKVMFAFCPNEDVGRAADAIDPSVFSPEILFDLDGPGGEVITQANFTARAVNVKFIGRDAHPGDAKAERLGDATAAAATYIASVPLQYRPENTEGLQGYIHPWSFEKTGADVVVLTRIRYFDRDEGAIFDRIVRNALERVARDFPNVSTEILYDGLQYENVAYTLHPRAKELVETAAARTGKEIVFADERGGTTASMFAAKGLNGGLCIFTGQHEIHSTREYADLTEMEEAYNLMLEIIRLLPAQP